MIPKSSPQIAFLSAFLSLISVQIGAATAKTVFPVLGSETVALMRLGLSSLILCIIFQPWKNWKQIIHWGDMICYGIILSLMNTLIYKSFESLSVGISISIEVLGPLTIAIFVSRQKLDLVWGLFALIGLALLPLGKIHNNFSYIGMFYSLGAAIFWGLYIIYGSKVSKGGGNSVAIGMTIATLFVLPLGIDNIHIAFSNSFIFMLCLLISIFSSALPFLLDIFAMKTLPPKIFGILLSTSPIVSSLAGWFILGENMSNYQIIGIVIIMIACFGCFLSSYKKHSKQV